MLKPEERTKVAQILQNYGVQLWFSGHLHDVLLQEHLRIFHEFQCGNFVSDGGKSTVLIGELDTDTGIGNVIGFLWQKDDGWIVNHYLNKADKKSDYPFRLNYTEKMLVSNQTRSNAFDTTMIEKNVEQAAIQRVCELYEERYDMTTFCRYGSFCFQVIARAVTPAQIDTIFVIRTVEPEQYSLHMMEEWMDQMLNQSRQYQLMGRRDVLMELQLIIRSGENDSREEIYRKDFQDLMDRNYQGMAFQLELLQESDLYDEGKEQEVASVFIDSVTILPKEKSQRYKNNGLITGDVTSVQPVLTGSYPSIHRINMQIDAYYEKVWKEWEDRLEDYVEELEHDLANGDRCTDEISELTATDSLTYRIMYHENGLLSLMFDRYFYLGGPHGTPLRDCFLYDLNTGVRLQLHELCSLDFEEIMDRIHERLRIKFEKDYDYEIVEISYERIAEQYQELDQFKFYVEKSGSLYIYFDIYEIGDYSMGYMDLYITTLDHPMSQKKRYLTTEKIIRKDETIKVKTTSLQSER